LAVVECTTGLNNSTRTFVKKFTKKKEKKKTPARTERDQAIAW